MQLFLEEEREKELEELYESSLANSLEKASLNEKGEMSAAVSTSGLAWKIPGRLGDSPIVGAGIYLDRDVGGAGPRC